MHAHVHCRTCLRHTWSNATVETRFFPLLPLLSPAICDTSYKKVRLYSSIANCKISAIAALLETKMNLQKRPILRTTLYENQNKQANLVAYLTNKSFKFLCSHMQFHKSLFSNFSTPWCEKVEKEKTVKSTRVMSFSFYWEVREEEEVDSLKWHSLVSSLFVCVCVCVCVQAGIKILSTAQIHTHTHTHAHDERTTLCSALSLHCSSEWYACTLKREIFVSN